MKVFKPIKVHELPRPWMNEEVDQWKNNHMPLKNRREGNVLYPTANGN